MDTNMKLYEHQVVEKRLLEKLYEAEEIINNENVWMSLEELKVATQNTNK